MNTTDLLSLCKIKDVKKIMQICQKLYLDGYITYPRTDSQYISKQFKLYNTLKNLKSEITNERIEKILEKNPKLQHRKGKIDSAHVAIIPLSILEEDKTDKEIYSVYSLILDRFLNCFQEKTIYKQIKIEFEENKIKYSTNLKEEIQKGWFKQDYDNIPSELFIPSKLTLSEYSIVNNTIINKEENILISQSDILLKKRLKSILPLYTYYLQMIYIHNYKYKN